MTQFLDLLMENEQVIFLWNFDADLGAEGRKDQARQGGGLHPFSGFFSNQISYAIRHTAVLRTVAADLTTTSAPRPSASPRPPLGPHIGPPLGTPIGPSAPRLLTKIDPWNLTTKGVAVQKR